MKLILLFLVLFLSLKFSAQELGKAEKLSIAFFDAVKYGKSDKADAYSKELANLDRQSLREELENDDKILAFWMNIYNSNIQYILKKDPSKFEDRGAFFKAKQVVIAGEILSFDIIEHGILRKSKSKLSLGYLSKIRVSKFERQFRIKKVDFRIHYALNCGALSCPPIVAYHSNKVNDELDKSISDYLKKYCVVSDDVVKVPVLFSWFRADFGGKRGIRKVLLKYDITKKEDKKKDLEFLPYDWTLALNPYK